MNLFIFIFLNVLESERQIILSNVSKRENCVGENGVLEMVRLKEFKFLLARSYEQNTKMTKMIFSDKMVLGQLDIDIDIDMKSGPWVRGVIIK